MTLKELIEHLNFIDNTYNEENIRVVVKESSPSIVVSSFSDISGVYDGFDWEKGFVYIVPEKKLVFEGNSKNDVITPNEETITDSNGRNRTRYICKKCRAVIKNYNDSNYCSHCGQRIR